MGCAPTSEARRICQLNPFLNFYFLKIFFHKPLDKSRKACYTSIITEGRDPGKAAFMKQYTILNLTTMEVLTCEAPQSCWLSDLCDRLYIQWELTPTYNRSMWALLNGDHLIFSYHQVEFVEVWLEPHTGRVLVRDLPAGWGQ